MNQNLLKLSKKSHVKTIVNQLGQLVESAEVTTSLYVQIGESSLLGTCDAVEYLYGDLQELACGYLICKMKSSENVSKAAALLQDYITIAAQIDKSKHCSLDLKNYLIIPLDKCTSAL